jgi:hypothetical protein
MAKIWLGAQAPLLLVAKLDRDGASLTAALPS